MGPSILWAPWRMGYIQRSGTKGCFLCRVRRSGRDRKNYVLCRGSHSFAVLNVFPYNNGHLMVVSNRHVRELDRLADEEVKELFLLVKLYLRVLKKTLKPHGFNLGINLGKCAGAGVAGHLHIHIVPRWEGDTNFMPVASGTKVIPQALAELYRILKKEFPKNVRG
jgi:ATP adenylyltransferase